MKIENEELARRLQAALVEVQDLKAIASQHQLVNNDFTVILVLVFYCS